MKRRSFGAHIEALLRRLWSRFYGLDATREEVARRNDEAPPPEELPTRNGDAPPSDVAASGNVAIDWDVYWEQQLASDSWRRSHRTRIGLSPFLRLRSDFKNSWHRVLIVGCGISTEPALLARLGYDVTAFDTSKVAVAHIEANPATEDEMASWLINELPESAWEETGYGRTLGLEGEARQDALRQTLERLARPGGSLTTTYRDFREFTPDEPFDVVYSPWSWQCLDEEGRAGLPRSAFGWLAPGGVAYFATQNISRALDDELSAACAAAGFFRFNGEADSIQHQLEAGGKMWTDFRASG